MAVAPVGLVRMASDSPHRFRTQTPARAGVGDEEAVVRIDGHAVRAAGPIDLPLPLRSGPGMDGKTRSGISRGRALKYLEGLVH
ncbi:hypothetical protein BKK79_19135 [Cupriavidus sp. USMAA2-4]|nr:hypothetical protein BKK79_19135 [Cupriavidus sp. USMAA2-4]